MSARPDVICWSCLQRSPLGKCIHCGETLTLPVAKKEPTEEDIKKKFIIQLQQKDGSTTEFYYTDLLKIVKKHFMVLKEIIVASPQFIVSMKNENDNVDEKFQNLYEESQQFIPGLVPILQRDTRLGINQYLISYSFLPQTKPSTGLVRNIFYFLSIFSVIISGLLVSIKYFNIMNQTNYGYLMIQNFYNPWVWVNTAIFSLIILGVLLIRMKIIELDFLKLSGYRPKFLWIFVPPFYEMGTLGYLVIEHKPHFNKHAAIVSSFRGNFISWIISSILLAVTSFLNYRNPEMATQFGKTSIVASGYYEPLIFRLLEMLFSSEVYVKSFLFHPAFIASLITFYITGLSFLPAIQLFGGSIVQSSSNRLIAYFTTFLVVIALFYVGLIWLAILIFLFQDRFGKIYVLNGASTKPRYWKLIVALILVVSILTFPLPLN